MSAGPRDAARVVLISGANRGIGLAIARHLRRLGYRTSLGARDPARLEAVFDRSDDCTFFHRFDAFEPGTAEAWVNATLERFGRIDALVNNAGLSERVGIEDDDDAALDRMWEVNVKAPLRLIRRCLPHLEATGRGRIVNIASMSGKRVRNAHVGYNMTKFAVMALTHTTRHIGWDRGIRATALCPSFVRSEMSSYTDKIRAEDMTQPETIAHLVGTLIELPNNAAIAELLVNCRLEDTL